MRKIVYCIPLLYNSGGMERVLTEKVNYLVATGNYDITIITTDQEQKSIYFPIDSRIKVVNFDLNFCEHYNWPLVKKYFAHKRKLAQYKRKLESFLLENEIDICVSLCGKEIDFLTSLKDRSRKIAELHFSKKHRALFLQARKQGLLWKWIGDFRSWQLKRATSRLSNLVVLTQQDLNDWLKTNKNVISIPNPSPLSPERTSILEIKKVITVGRLDAQKGYDYLIEAWEMVAKRYPEWTLDIYGSGELKNELQKQIADSGLDKKVHLSGTTKNIEEVYMSSSIFVMSSRYEGLPMVLIEAMSCGLPLVSFDCECGPREVIQNGKNGFLVPTFDIKLLADKLMLLMENVSLRKTMGSESKNMSSKYSVNEIMQHWMNLFDKE